MGPADGNSEISQAPLTPARAGLTVRWGTNPQNRGRAGWPEWTAEPCLVSLPLVTTMEESST